MQKVAIITYDLDWTFAGGAKSGGASVVNRNLILELAKRDDVKLSILCLPTEMKVENATIITISHGNGYDGFLKDIENKIAEENFDIVLTLSLEYMKKNPMLQSQTFRHRCKNEPFPVNIFKMIFGKKKIKHQDKMFENLPSDNKYFAVSNSVKKDYVENYGLKAENVHVCHLGTPQIFENMPEIMKNEKITFGCVANNSINKGGIYFLVALALAKITGCKDFRAKLVSKKFKKSPLIAMLINILGLKDNIEIIEQNEGLKEFYEGIDCLVLPSKNEAFGLVVVEAMAYGKPCIVSDTTGVSEIITNDNGIVFDRNSIIDFTKKIKKAVKTYGTEEYKTLSEKAFETSKNYTWQKFAQCVLDKF